MSETLAVGLLIRKRNAHNCMIVKRMVHARRLVAASVDALALF